MTVLKITLVCPKLLSDSFTRTTIFRTLFLMFTGVGYSIVGHVVRSCILAYLFCRPTSHLFLPQVNLYIFSFVSVTFV